MRECRDGVAEGSQIATPPPLVQLLRTAGSPAKRRRVADRSGLDQESLRLSWWSLSGSALGGVLGSCPISDPMAAFRTSASRSMSSSADWALAASSPSAILQRDVRFDGFTNLVDDGRLFQVRHQGEGLEERLVESTRRSSS